MSVHQLRREAWHLGGDDARTAIALLEIALRRDPADAEVLWQKALFEYAERELVGAESSLKRLIAVRPLDLEAMGLLVKVLRRRGCTSEASVWYRRREDLRALLAG
jgi:Flp pilus assembly protein TadD